MVNEFDKEIDAMLRDLAKGETFTQTLPEMHLDADEISAFAENALPKKARVRITGHLADCSKCRRILANFALLNSEAESEIIHEEVKTIASVPAIPWYKSLFAMPNLAYTMGAMALLLVGMVSLLVLQSSNNSESMVAQSNKPAEKVSGPNLGTSEGDAFGTQPYSANSNASSAANAPVTMATPSFAPAANSAANSTANSSVTREAMPVPPSASSDSNTSALKSGTVSDDEKVAEIPAKKGGDTPKDSTPKEEAKPVTETTNDNVGERRDMNKQQVEIQQNQAQNVQNISPDQNVQRTRTAPQSPNLSGGVPEQPRAEKPKAKKTTDKADEDATNRAAETRKIGEKTFRNTGGVWTDTSYTGGSTKNVKRGSDDYKKLDSGLQNIANSLGGTVIIVWGGKNYKIQ